MFLLSNTYSFLNNYNCNNIYAFSYITDIFLINIPKGTVSLLNFSLKTSTSLQSRFYKQSQGRY